MKNTHSKQVTITMIVCFATMFLHFLAKAQSSDPTAIRYGLGGAFLLNRHDPAFSQLQGLPTCCNENYASTGSQGWSVQGSAELPLTKIAESVTLSGAARISYLNGLGANLLSLERQPAAVQTNSIGDVVFQHKFSPMLSLIAIEPLISLRFFKWFSVYGGIQAGTWLQQSFSYEERIQSPSNIVYVRQNNPQYNGKTFRNEVSGALPNVNLLQLALIGGISVELPVTRTGTILPTLEAFYTYSLTSPVSGVNWRISSLRVGASLRFSPNRTTELSAQEIEQKYQDSIKAAQEIVARALAEAKEARQKQLDAKINDIRPIFFDDDDTSPKDTTSRNIGGAIAAKLSLDNFELSVQRVATVQFIELLPMLFFNENSSVLPVRYKTVIASDASKFSIDTPSLISAIQKNPIAAYYQVLNILGKRLQATTSAKLIITGVATDKEQDGTFLADALAERRAQAISNYLQDVWRVPANRIITKSRIIAASATASASQKDAEEMRRVELSSDDVSLLQPLRVEGEKLVVTPPGLQISMQISAGQGLKQWDLDVSQANGQEVATLSSMTGGANYPDRIVCDFRANPPISTEDISIRLAIDDASNNKFESPIIAVKVKQNPERGNLQMFTLLQANTPLTSNITTAKKSTKFPVQVRSMNPDFLKAFTTLSISSSKSLKKPIFDENLPEGRIYNRGGVIEVR